MYDKSPMGTVFSVSNMIFDGKVDHAYRKGRLCILIYSDDEYDYFLSISSNKSKSGKDFEYYKLGDDDFSYLYKYDSIRNSSKFHDDAPSGYVNLIYIYKRKISGFGSREIGKLKYESYKKLIDKLKYYHNRSEMNNIVESAKVVR